MSLRCQTKPENIEIWLGDKLSANISYEPHITHT